MYFPFVHSLTKDSILSSKSWKKSFLSFNFTQKKNNKYEPEQRLCKKNCNYALTNTMYLSQIHYSMYLTGKTPRCAQKTRSPSAKCSGLKLWIKINSSTKRKQSFSQALTRGKPQNRELLHTACPGDLGWCAQQERRLCPPPQPAVQLALAWARLLPQCHEIFYQAEHWACK